MPPVLHVPLLELARSGPQQMLASYLAPGGCQGHHVLELVAEAIGAGGLVEGRARPDPAGEGLVEKPPVEQDVHGSVGRLDLHGGQRVVPHPPHGGKAGVEILAPVACDEPPRVGLVFALAEQEDDARPLAGSEAQRRLQRGAGVETRARLSREPSLARERGGRVERSVTPEELGAVRRPGGWLCSPGARGTGRSPAGIEVREGHASGELLVPGVAGEERTGLRVALRDDGGSRGTALAAEHPFGIGGDREDPVRPGTVLDGKKRDLEGVLERNELREVQPDAPAFVLEAAVALAVPRHVGPRVAHGKRRRSPDLSGLLVADQDGLARRVADGIVGPGRQLVLLTVDRPRTART